MIRLWFQENKRPEKAVRLYAMWDRLWCNWHFSSCKQEVHFVFVSREIGFEEKSYWRLKNQFDSSILRWDKALVCLINVNDSVWRKFETKFDLVWSNQRWNTIKHKRREKEKFFWKRKISRITIGSISKMSIDSNFNSTEISDEQRLIAVIVRLSGRKQEISVSLNFSTSKVFRWE